MNSFYVLLGFITFTVLGYFSFVRLLFKQEIPQEPAQRTSVLASLKQTGVLGSLVRSWVFVSLPGLAALLFWGWGPALLWVVISHLLVETTTNFITLKMHRQVSLAAHFSDFDSLNSTLRASLLQLLLLSLIAVLVVLLATLIDDQTGLLFAMVCIVAAIQLLRSAKGAVDAVLKLLGAVALLVLGLLLAKSIGIAVFGELVLAPSQAPWLKVNNQTLLVLLLLYASARISRSQSLTSGLTTLTGGLIMLLVAVIFFYLALSQPELDAPLLTSAENASNLPPFATIFLLISPSLLLVLMQIVVAPNRANGDDDYPPLSAAFTARQLLSGFSLLVSLIVVVAVGTASGIGAWNTHFSSWETTSSLGALFTLVYKSFNSLSGFAGLSDQSLSTLLTVSICLFGISCLVFCTRLLQRQIELAAEEASQEKSRSASLIATAAPQYMAVFVAGAWLLSNGMQIELWMWILSLAWVLCSDVLCDYARDMETASFGDHLRRGFALTIFLLGAIQLAWTGLSQLLQGQPISATLLLLNLMIGGLMCAKNAKKCWQGLQIRDDAKLFEG